jgi:hypothetical protein
MAPYITPADPILSIFSREYTSLLFSQQIMTPSTQGASVTPKSGVPVAGTLTPWPFATYHQSPASLYAEPRASTQQDEGIILSLAQWSTPRCWSVVRSALRQPQRRAVVAWLDLPDLVWMKKRPRPSVEILNLYYLGYSTATVISEVLSFFSSTAYCPYLRSCYIDSLVVLYSEFILLYAYWLHLSTIILHPNLL